MVDVLRWGRSAYESDADLAAEREEAHALGLTWGAAAERGIPAALATARFLVVTSGVRVDQEVIDRFAGQCVLTTTSGFDHIDVGAARRRGVVVGRCPLARRDPVVEAAVGGMILLRRRFGALDAAAREGRWAREDLPALAPSGLSGAVVVVVGHGVIGQRAAAVLDALGAEVRAVDPRGVVGRRAWAWPDALEGADGVTLHCSLSSTSGGLMGTAEIARLAPGAVVVNTARGDVLDVDAAVAAVRSGWLGGLCVDVFPVEPYPRLKEAAIPGVLLTPHSAGFTVGLGARVAAEVGAALRAWVEGRGLPFPVG